jgi:hypothetical protein
VDFDSFRFISNITNLGFMTHMAPDLHDDMGKEGWEMSWSDRIKLSLSNPEVWRMGTGLGRI